jgi:hypothetical protein
MILQKPPVTGKPVATEQPLASRLFHVKRHGHVGA